MKYSLGLDQPVTLERGLNYFEKLPLSALICSKTEGFVSFLCNKKYKARPLLVNILKVILCTLTKTSMPFGHSLSDKLEMGP